MNFLYVSSIFICSLLTFSQEEIIDLLKSKDTFEYFKISKVPKSIKKKMQENVKEPILFASKNKKFNLTDVVEDENLPFRRIIFVLYSKKINSWLLYYEHGGRGYNIRLAYFKMKDKKNVKEMYNLTLLDNEGFDINSKDELIERVKNRKYVVLYNNGDTVESRGLSF